MFRRDNGTRQKQSLQIMNYKLQNLWNLLVQTLRIWYRLFIS